MKISLFALFILCGFFGPAGNAAAAETSKAQYSAFFSGTQFKQADRKDRIHYLAGVVDNMTSMLEVDNKPKQSKLEGCTRGWTAAQFLAVVDKWLDANPEVWNFSASSLIGRALAVSCHL